MSSHKTSRSIGKLFWASAIKSLSMNIPSASLIQSLAIEKSVDLCFQRTKHPPGASIIQLPVLEQSILGPFLSNPHKKVNVEDSTSWNRNPEELLHYFLSGGSDSNDSNSEVCKDSLGESVNRIIEMNMLKKSEEIKSIRKLS
ncbi:hypothetical protein E2C01_024769 [Portunus trituberculatus]|uniref:Uncharacterized protein n=1 Tax=Portunus trituberculatus TaxID=210409 RepID=A0A5B7EDR9_PORTR|nr:hypothetical protein [Portunus trituberculatus]